MWNRNNMAVACRGWCEARQKKRLQRPGKSSIARRAAAKLEETRSAPLAPHPAKDAAKKGEPKLP